MANVLFIKGNTATINGTAIADGQLLWNTVTGEIWEDVGTSRIPCGKLVDTSLNPISPNAVSNQAITGSIVNLLSTVLSTTEDYVPCGTKPVKELYDARNGAVLWTNGTPTNSFASGDRTLSEAITNFTQYEIKYLIINNLTKMVSTGRIPITYQPRLSAVSTIIFLREITAISGTTITFGAGQQILLATGAQSENNAVCIPYQVIGWK